MRGWVVLRLVGPADWSGERVNSGVSVDYHRASFLALSAQVQIEQVNDGAHRNKQGERSDRNKHAGGLESEAGREGIGERVTADVGERGADIAAAHGNLRGGGADSGSDGSGDDGKCGEHSDWRFLSAGLSVPTNKT